MHWTAMVAAAFLMVAMQAAVAQPLVDGDWLQQRLDDEMVVVVDLREEADEYRQAHIPGAVYTDYVSGGWRTTVGDVYGILPSVPVLEALVGSLGIENESHVVFVPSGRSASEFANATRMYWTFKVIGHDAVSILDGGWEGWRNAGRPVASGGVVPAESIYTAGFRPNMLIGREEVEQARRRGVPLLDHRPRALFSGEEASPIAKRIGTIAGARSLPEEVFTDGGRFLPPERLRALWAGVGVDPQAEQITFCNSGHWASLGWFALHEILGNRQVRLYDGSIADWSRHPELPMTLPGGAAAPAAR